MSKRDYYDVLGISKSASKDEIRKAYRSLSKKYHPDLNKADDAVDKFKEVTEAYEVLSDDSKKANYDQFGHTDPNQGFGGLVAVAELTDSASMIYSVRFSAEIHDDAIRMPLEKATIYSIR